MDLNVYGKQFQLIPIDCISTNANGINIQNSPSETEFSIKSQKQNKSQVHKFNISNQELSLSI